MPLLKLKYYCLGLLWLLSGLSFALGSDKDQMMRIFADSAELSQKDHQGIYTGHVQFAQGSTNIRADHAITKVSIENNQLILAIINGSKAKQAHYWTSIDAKKPPMHAYADSIRYYPLRHLIELQGNALIKQGNNSFSAATITYDILAQHVVSRPNDKKRTRIILYPEKKNV